MERPTQQEILGFLMDSRPDLSEADWRRGDPVTIMQWAIPGFVAWKARREQTTSTPLRPREEK